MRIRILMTGRGYHAAQTLPSELDVQENASLTDALQQLRATAGSLVVDSMMVLVDGRHVGTVASHEAVPLSDDTEVELLAPVAGG